MTYKFAESILYHAEAEEKTGLLLVTILHGSYGLATEKVFNIKPYTAHWLHAVLPAFLSQLHWIKHMSAMSWSSTSQLRAPPPREVCEVISYVTKKQFKLNE
jgi:hypothetical protein